MDTLRRSVRSFLLLAMAAAALYLLIWAWPLWRALLIAALLAYLLHPLVNRLERRWPGKRKWLVAIVYLLVVLLLIGIITILGTYVWNSAANWAAELRIVWQDIREWLNRPLNIYGVTVEPQILVDYLQEAAINAFSGIQLGGAGGLGIGLTDNIIWLLITAVAIYYLLLDGQKLIVAGLRWLPRQFRPEVRALLAEMDRIWSTFMRVQLLIFAVVGSLVVAATLLIVWIYRQGWLPISPLALIILLIVVYSAIQQVDNLWLRPRYMGKTLAIHPGVTIIALLSAFALSGLLGALLIIPVLATLKVILTRIPWRRLLLDNLVAPPRS